MKLKLIRFDELRNLFHCDDEEGNRHYVDFFVSSSHSGFGQTRKLTNKKWLEKMHSLEGRYVEVGRMHPYEEIAHDVKLINP